jgi:hypothetical protein
MIEKSLVSVNSNNNTLRDTMKRIIIKNTRRGECTRVT